MGLSQDAEKSEPPLGTKSFTSKMKDAFHSFLLKLVIDLISYQWVKAFISLLLGCFAFLEQLNSNKYSFLIKIMVLSLCNFFLLF